METGIVSLLAKGWLQLHPLPPLSPLILTLPSASDWQASDPPHRTFTPSYSCF